MQTQPSSPHICAVALTNLYYSPVANFHAINNGVIPPHEHPTWHDADVQHAIGEAVHISAGDFAGITERRKERLAGRYLAQWNPWERAQWIQFFAFPHRADPHYRLYIRRDMQEAYSVHDAEHDPNHAAGDT